MAIFAENMKALTDELAASVQRRTAILQSLRVQTEQHLADADALVRRLSEERAVTGNRLCSMLCGNRQERTQEVAETLDEMAQRFQELQVCLHQALQACREARHEYVERMIQGFDETQQELANDLQEASRI